jgi:hypothetical protein
MPAFAPPTPASSLRWGSGFVSIDLRFSDREPQSKRSRDVYTQGLCGFSSKAWFCDNDVTVTL